MIESVKINIPLEKVDKKSTVIARDFTIFDAPIKHEREFDYDDYEGVIDDLDNPYDKTLPILVGNPNAFKFEKGIEMLGGKCITCGNDNPLVLRIDRIHNDGKYQSPKTLNRLVENMNKKGLNPSRKFQILCQNCNVLKQKINRYRRNLGLPQIPKVSLDQEIVN